MVEAGSVDHPASAVKDDTEIRSGCPRGDPDGLNRIGMGTERAHAEIFG
jgi:hypothetical protein